MLDEEKEESGVGKDNFSITARGGMTRREMDVRWAAALRN